MSRELYLEAFIKLMLCLTTGERMRMKWREIMSLPSFCSEILRLDYDIDLVVISTVIVRSFILVNGNFLEFPRKN